MKTLIALACLALATTSHAWTYADHQDQMSGGKIHTASVTSSTVIELGFPYQGPQRAQLTLRKHPRESQEVMLLIERGQLQDKGLTIRFDDNPPVRYATAGPADNSTTLLFLVEPQRFIKAAKAAKRVLIEAQLFQEGTRVLAFDVSGLEW